jgi:DNA polymerase III epsilon subunit-like protein
MAKLSQMPLVFLDTETSGLDPLVNGVMQVGLIRTTADLKVTEVYDELVQPYGYLVQPKALEVNGLNLEECQEDGLPSAEVSARVAEVCEGAVIVGHNIRFDLEFLRTMFRISGTDFKIGRRTIDTQSLAWAMVPQGLESLSLDGIRAHLRLKPREGKHDALEDAELTLEVYRHLTAVKPAYIPRRGSFLSRVFGYKTAA